MSQAADAVVVEPDYGYDCGALNKISADHRPLVAEYCPKCQGYGQDCLIAQMELVSKSLEENSRD